MKIKRVTCIILSSIFVTGSALTVQAAPAAGLPQSGRESGAPERSEENGGPQEAAETEEAVLRNTVFTTSQMMREMMGREDSSWSIAYLPEVEQIYWNLLMKMPIL